MAEITYYKSHSYTDKKENKINFSSQLYSIGVYIIINNNPSLQGSLSPHQILKIQNKLKKQEKKGEIFDLKFNFPITVTDKSGVWEEVKDNYKKFDNK